MHNSITEVADTIYDKMISGMQKYADENISICGTSREGHYELVINEGTNMDDLSKPTNTLLARKKKTKHIKDNDKTEEVSEDANDESPKDEK